MRWVYNVVGVRCRQCSRVHSSAAKMRLSCCGELAVAPLGPGSVGVAAGLGRGHQARETAVQTVNLCALGISRCGVRVLNCNDFLVHFSVVLVLSGRSALCNNPLPWLEEKLWPHLANSSSSGVMSHHEPGRGGTCSIMK